MRPAVAMEYAPERIRVNALVAGAFDTPMLNNAVERSVGRRRYRTPQGDGAKVSFNGSAPPDWPPEEAVEAIAWLCSEASSYVTAHSMIVDGGLTA